ncbi:hypothetical protein [Paracoccus seriniphilus]|uniref:hypothetical protein n=1 Tax=Paracoccus seriniphilus TaxID=184748 RepID=UPI0035693334
MNGLIGHFHMQGIAVGVGIDGHRRDAHLAGGLDDPAGDLTPVGNQDFLEHGVPRSKRHEKTARDPRSRTVLNDSLRTAMARRSNPLLAEAHVVAQGSAGCADCRATQNVFTGEICDDSPRAGADKRAVSVGRIDVLGAGRNRDDREDRREGEKFPHVPFPVS